MDNKPKLLARAFDIVTCVDGHPCYMTTAAIRQCDLMSSGIFMALGDALPIRPMTQVDGYRCPKCAGEIFKGGMFYVRMFYVRGQLRGHEGVYADEAPPIDHYGNRKG